MVPWSEGITLHRMEKTISLRIDQNLLRDLKTIAHIREVSVSAIIRYAVGQYVTKVKEDPEFKTRIDWYRNRVGELAGD